MENSGEGVFHKVLYALGSAVVLVALAAVFVLLFRYVCLSVSLMLGYGNFAPEVRNPWLPFSWQMLFFLLFPVMLWAVFAWSFPLKHRMEAMAHAFFGAALLLLLLMFLAVGSFLRLGFDSLFIGYLLRFMVIGAGPFCLWFAYGAFHVFLPLDPSPIAENVTKPRTLAPFVFCTVLAVGFSYFIMENMDPGPVRRLRLFAGLPIGNEGLGGAVLWAYFINMFVLFASLTKGSRRYRELFVCMLVAGPVFFLLPALQWAYTPWLWAMAVLLLLMLATCWLLYSSPMRNWQKP